MATKAELETQVEQLQTQVTSLKEQLESSKREASGISEKTNLVHKDLFDQVKGDLEKKLEEFQTRITSASEMIISLENEKLAWQEEKIVLKQDVQAWKSEAEKRQTEIKNSTLPLIGGTLPNMLMVDGSTYKIVHRNSVKGLDEDRRKRFVDEELQAVVYDASKKIA